MSPGDDEIILPETKVEHFDNEPSKLVPVAESIRYRKRAQSAEKRCETLAGQLEQVQAESGEMAGQLNDMHFEQKLTQKLAAAGVIDLETAVLVAKAKVKESDQKDLDDLIERLKREKQYLFSTNVGGIAMTQKTAAAKDRTTNKQTVLERAAERAAKTGNRIDLQEYLKLRRNFL